MEDIRGGGPRFKIAILKARAGSAQTAAVSAVGFTNAAES